MVRPSLITCISTFTRSAWNAAYVIVTCIRCPFCEMLDAHASVVCCRIAPFSLFCYAQWTLSYFMSYMLYVLNRPSSFFVGSLWHNYRVASPPIRACHVVFVAWRQTIVFYLLGPQSNIPIVHYAYVVLSITAA